MHQIRIGGWWVVIGSALLALGCAATPKDQAGPVAEEKAAAAAVPAENGGEVSAGQAIYDGNCGVCHRLGKYDTEGRGNLTRRVGEIDAAFLSGHHGSSLSAGDIAALKAFVSSY